MMQMRANKTGGSGGPGLFGGGKGKGKGMFGSKKGGFGGGRSMGGRRR